MSRCENAEGGEGWANRGKKILFCGCSGGESVGKGREIFVKKI